MDHEKRLTRSARIFNWACAGAVVASSAAALTERPNTEVWSIMLLGINFLFVSALFEIAAAIRSKP